MPEFNLESQSLWYKYKTQVWLADTPQTAVVHNIMRVLRAFRNYGRLAYVSVPITSGKFLYDLQLERPLMSPTEQLKRAIEHNYRIGLDFVKELEKRKLNFPILYPADLVPIHQQWEQAHFQALWLSIIGEKCTELHMSQGWQYSNGGTEEFTHAWQLKLGLPKHRDLVFFNTKETEESERWRMRNILTFDHRGNLITLEKGIQALQLSIDHLGTQFNPVKLINCLKLLQNTNEMLTRGFYQ